MWQDYAACADVDPDAMQPDRPRPSQMMRARSLCGACPVRPECGELAGSHAAYGFWAGHWYGPWEPMTLEESADPAQVARLAREGATVRDLAVRYDVSRWQIEQALDAAG